MKEVAASFLMYAAHLRCVTCHSEAKETVSALEEVPRRQALTQEPRSKPAVCSRAASRGMLEGLLRGSDRSAASNKG